MNERRIFGTNADTSPRVPHDKESVIKQIGADALEGILGEPGSALDDNANRETAPLPDGPISHPWRALG